MKRIFKSASILDVFALAITVLYIISFVNFAWVGFSESDDAFYAEAAEGWQGHWYVAKTHWGLRHAIVLPMAWAFGVFGRSEWSLVFPTLLYLALLLGLSFFAVRKIAGYYGGLIAMALIVSIPAVATGSSWVTTDLAETFFLLASVWIFFYAIQDGKPAYLVLSGVAAGLGSITRETSIVLLAFYGILMIVNYGGRRTNYLWIALGAALVIGLDTLYLGASTGDYVYRLHVSQLGVKGDNPDMSAKFMTQQGLDRFGTLTAPRWLQALFVLFLNQSFGIIPWMGLAATIHLSLKGTHQRRSISRVMLFFALIWFIVLSYIFTFLWLVPRYQIPTAVALTIPLAIWLADACAKTRHVVTGAALTAAVLSGIAIVGVSDRNPLFGEKQLAAQALETSKPIKTDPSTLRGARWLLEANGAIGHVSSAAPQDGDIYFYSDRPRRGIPPEWPIQRPEPGWIVIRSFEEPARPLAQLLLAIGLDKVVPAPIAAKLKPSPRRATVYRVVGSPKVHDPA